MQLTSHNTIEHVYSADGMKLRTIHSTAVSGLTVQLHQTHTLTAAETMYVDSTTYSGDVEIDQGRNTKWYFGEGYVQQTPSGSATTYYTIKDYLGNIRKVMKSDGTVVQKQNYYAFGGILNETNNYTDIQTHKYNGKEYDPMHGLNLYDYGARQYDPAISKFTTMDPLCEKYYHISPYAYCAGNPVNRVDVDGDSINFGPLLNQDHAKKRKTAQYILQDLRDFTGLDLYFSNGYLHYNKENNTVCGSQTACKLLKSAIDNPLTISIGENGTRSLFDDVNIGIGICDSQILEFINETPPELDKRTLGYGMVFMHELAHSPIGGSMKDPHEPLEYVQGNTVIFINSIRKELDDNPSFNKNGCFGIRSSYGIITQNNGERGIPFSVPNKKKSLFIKTSF